jgi:RecA-family ATPase
MLNATVQTINAGPINRINGLNVDTANNIIIFEKIDILEAFDVKPEPLDFVLPGLIIGTVGAIVAPGATGKSMLAMEVALSITTAIDFAGLFDGAEIKRGDVVYFAAEDPALAIQHRLHEMGKHIETIDKDHSRNARMNIHEGFTVIPLMGKQPDIFNELWFNSIKEAVRGCRLLIIDTIRRFHKLEENDGGQMADMLSRLEAIATEAGCAIVFIHHSSKAAALNGQGDMQQASRGSSVLVDNVRWQMYLAGMSKDEAKEKGLEEVQRNIYVKCGVSKQNYGKPFVEKWLEKIEGGVLVGADLNNKDSVFAKKKNNASPRHNTNNAKKDW